MRSLVLLLICFGAVVDRPFKALLLTGAVSRALVIGILIKGWALIRDNKGNGEHPMG